MKNKKVILVEDDQSIIDVYKTVFEANKIDLDVICWGKEAIERVKNISEHREDVPDLFLLDLILPDIGGLEILREIRSSDRLKNATVFVLSNYTNSGLPQMDFVKADKFILKTNITPTELIDLVKKQIGL